MNSRRLFIGLFADEQTRKAILSYQMTWDWPASARIVVPERLHLTLAFLGSVNEQDEVRLTQELASVPLASFALKLTTAGSFEHGVAWIAPRPSIELQHLRGHVVGAIQASGLRADNTYAWTPHVTLATDSTAASVAKQPDITWTISGFALMQTVEGRYHAVQTFPQRRPD